MNDDFQDIPQKQVLDDDKKYDENIAMFLLLKNKLQEKTRKLNI